MTDSNNQKSNPETTAAWLDLFYALFWLGTGIALMFTDAQAFGGMLIGLWVGRYM